MIFISEISEFIEMNKGTSVNPKQNARGINDIKRNN